MKSIWLVRAATWGEAGLLAGLQDDRVEREARLEQHEGQGRQACQFDL
jgi:hypothetical protein